MNRTDTGGGSSIGGGVGTDGGNFAGRDAPTQQVNLQFGDRSPKEIAEILRRLQVTTYGDLEAGIRGLVRDIQELRQELALVKTELVSVKSEVKELKEEVAERKITSYNMQAMLYLILFGLAILIVIAYWKW
jgi:hypothetical protein